MAVQDGIHSGMAIACVPVPIVFKGRGSVERRFNAMHKARSAHQRSMRYGSRVPKSQDNRLPVVVSNSWGLHYVMIKDNQHPAESATGNGADQADRKPDGTMHPSDPIAAKLHEEAKVLTAAAMDLLKHPRRCAEMGLNLAESTAGESLGELVGASLGTMVGPEGTVIGAEVGGLVGEVFGVRQGAKITEKIFHHAGNEHRLKEEVLEKSSSKLGGHAGGSIGRIIGEALFDDAGGDLGEAVGNKLGGLAGDLAFEQVANAHQPE